MKAIVLDKTSPIENKPSLQEIEMRKFGLILTETIVVITELFTKTASEKKSLDSSR